MSRPLGWGGTRGVLAKDLDDDFALCWDDIAEALDRFPRCVEIAADGVAIDSPARVLVCAHENLRWS